MERALSFQTQIEAKVFATQDALAEAIGLSKGQVAKMLEGRGRAQARDAHGPVRGQERDPRDPGLQPRDAPRAPWGEGGDPAGGQEPCRDGEGRAPAEVLRVLIASLDRSKKFQPVQKQYNVGTARRVTVTRNARGKVTLAFPQGLAGVERAEVIKAVEEILKDLA